MRNRSQYFTLFLLIVGTLAGMFLLRPPRKLVLVVEKLPSNTPIGAAIFVAGNFNYWDPGDGSFQLQKNEDGTYFIELPLGWGEVRYRFTRGDWTTVEADGCGHQMKERKQADAYSIGALFGEKVLKTRIHSWEDLGPTDCQTVVIQVKNIPKETPASDEIYIAGSFNDWNPGSSAYKMKKNGTKYRYISLAKNEEDIEFKFTRGSWEKEEVDANGERQPNRKFSFGQHDTLDVDIAGWLDVKPGMEARKITFIASIPYGTPVNDPIYIVGSFNNWLPGDPRYKMTRLKPYVYGITINKPEGEMEYKFTRGPWGKEEVDVFGNHISNRKLRTSADTLHITIPEWVDIPVDQTYTMTRTEMNTILNQPEMITFPFAPGAKNIFFQVHNDGLNSQKLYARIALPSAPANRNYGFITTIEPGETFSFVCPVGSKIYACDGKYWGDYTPKECLVLEVDGSKTGVQIPARQLVWSPGCKKISMKTLQAMDLQTELKLKQMAKASTGKAKKAQPDCADCF